VSIVFALLCALTYGAGDFFGGFSARRIHPFVTGLIVQSSGAVPILVIAYFVGAKHLDGTTVAWGMGGGIAGAFGLICLYTALARTPMSVVAPISALIAATVPVLVGVFEGERPTTWQWIGIVCALVAIVVISGASGDNQPSSENNAPPTQSISRMAFLYAFAAGLGFGAFFVALDKAGRESALWPVAFAKLGGLIILSAAFFGSKNLRAAAKAKPIRPGVPTAMLSGILDLSANTFFLLATRRGLLSTVSVISSLYPASTVLLAYQVLKERITRIQLLGMLLAVCAIVLVASS
jgi:drug/metabolite transporter (DMT)-like permease